MTIEKCHEGLLRAHTSIHREYHFYLLTIKLDIFGLSNIKNSFLMLKTRHHLPLRVHRSIFLKKFFCFHTEIMYSDLNTDEFHAQK